MSIRRPSVKTLAIMLAGVYVAYLLFAWLALPPILQSIAERFVAAHAGHRLSLDRPAFNPFTLNLRLSNLRLDEPDGKPLFALRQLDVNLSMASVFRWAAVFDGIRLEAPQATVTLRSDGSLNWSALLAAFAGKDDSPAATPSLPRLKIDRFALVGGRFDFGDERAGFATRVEPLDLELSEVSTLPDDEGRYRISARTGFGARLMWQGEATLNPVSLVGNIRVDDVDLARLAPYVTHALPLKDVGGTLALSTDYRLDYAAGHADLALEKASAKLAGLRLVAAMEGGPGLAVDAIELSGGRYALNAKRLALDGLTLNGIALTLPRPNGEPVTAQLGGFSVDKLQADLAGRSLSVDRIALKDGRLSATRDARGRIDLLDALVRSASSTAASASAAKVEPAAPAWRYQVAKVEASGFAAVFRDRSVDPAAEFAADDIALAIDHVSDRLAAPLPLRASFRSRHGGSFAASGNVVPAEPAADLQFKLADLALKPAEPYVASLAKLALTSGRFSADGRVRYGKRGVRVNGGFALRDLRLDEAETGQIFLAWKSLHSPNLAASAKSLDLGDLFLDGLDTKLIIDADKSVNLTRIFRTPQPDAAVPAAPAQAAASATKPEAPGFLVNIERVRFSDGALDFADHSLALPFGTRIHGLRGAVNGLSSRPGGAGQVELDGEVDDYGLARAVGQIDLFNPTAFTDLKVVFSNVEMTRLTPYSATFAGRRIDSGKLSLNLEYKIKDRQLAGDNQVLMDQLTLGERVESPQAKNLPLDLAIAILEDADGRIDLGLPVSGSLDDPQFSYGGIIWKAFLNVMGKIATAPFRALGALFGGGEKFENIAFEAGAAHLTPPEREKLVRLAAALKKRPRLGLVMHGTYAESDRLALQDRQLRRAVARGAGQSVGDGDDPGPLSTASPKVQAALESLFADRFGGGELAALKDGYRKANPGQLEESVAGRMLSRLSGAFREKRALNETEITQLKGADFHGVLFERLRQGETVTDVQLTALATARGEDALAVLKAAAAPLDRVTMGAPDKAEGDGREVPIKLELAAAAKPAAAANPKPQ